MRNEAICHFWPAWSVAEFVNIYVGRPLAEILDPEASPEAALTILLAHAVAIKAD